MKSEITVVLDGITYKMRLSVRSLIAIEDELGVPLSKLPTELSIKSSVTFVRHAIRKVTGEMLSDFEFDALLDNVDAGELFGAMQKLIEAFGPAPKSGEPSKNE